MRYLVPLFVLASALAATACDDPNSFRIDPLLVEDTVVLAAPTAATTLPSALDITASGGEIVGRFPERVGDAERFDVVIRQRNGQLVFLPAGAIGAQNPPPVGGPSRAAITRALSEGFDQLVEAPGRASFVTDEAVPIREGAVFVIRSREGPGSFGTCRNFAKVQVLEVAPAEARVRLRVIANARCNDPRLVEEV